MNIIYNELQYVISKYRRLPNVEIELRLGWKDNGVFKTDIQEHFHNMIKKRFEHTIQKTNDQFFRKTLEETNVYICNKKRIITDMNNNILQCHHKKKLENIDIQLEGTPYDLRISVSVEKPCE